MLLISLLGNCKQKIKHPSISYTACRSLFPNIRKNCIYLYMQDKYDTEP